MNQARQAEGIQAMRRVKWRVWVGIGVLAAVAVTGWRLLSNRRAAPFGQAPAITAALLELHRCWETNQNRLPQPWPASIKALHVNGIAVNRFSAAAYWRSQFCGIRSCNGYEVHRPTQDSSWTLYRFHSWELCAFRELRWRSATPLTTRESKDTAMPVEKEN